MDYTLLLQRIETCLTQAMPDTPDTLTAPCRALLTLGGKRWRPLLLVLAASLASDKDDQATLTTACGLAPLVEFAHTASLIHDDIEDSSDTRRGAPAAHIRWGIDIALNAASWLYFQAPECIAASALPESRRHRLLTLYLEELRQLHLGQSMDIAWHKDDQALPSLEDYLVMTRLKTGTLASLAVKTGLIAGGAEEDTARKAGVLAAQAGAAFQILDDVTNLTTGNPGKKRGDDIVEGKKSLPVLLHAARCPGDFPRIGACFAQARLEGPESPAVEACIALLEESGAIADAARIAKETVGAACKDFKALFPDRPHRTKPIAELLTRLCDPKQT